MVDGLADASFETAAGFLDGLAGGDLALVETAGQPVRGRPAGHLTRASRRPERPGSLRSRIHREAQTLRLLASRRDELVGLRPQAVCRLHRELQILIHVGAKRMLTATKAKVLLASVRPRDEVGKVRKASAMDHGNRRLNHALPETGRGQSERLPGQGEAGAFTGMIKNLG